MAEIKTTFTKGRMNKDLDERLVPKGEYRDAVNVEVSTSEGSNVGTVQNILGNSRVEDIVPSGFICVGSIANEANNKLYWLTSSVDKDIIYEYDVEKDQASLVFVDINKMNANACLKFGNKIITGLNILDNFLLFTDGENEPKKINIKRSKTGTVDANTQTVLLRKENDVISNNVGPVREEDITVIKKRPTTPLSFKINKSNSNKEKGIFEKTFPRFSYRYKYSDNEYSAFGPFTNPVFSADYTDDFNSASFYNKKEGFNTAMLNTIESIELTGFVKPSTPRGVVSVDILFKREDSNVVYSVETLNIDEINKTENIDQSRGTYVVTTENIFAAINENQILRPFDNVPKTALAQEVVGNRIVYGNYTQGYNVDEVKVNSNYSVRKLQDKTFLNGGLESLKAQRDYQVGVVFGDKYGRETPVFTSDEGSVVVPWSNTSVSDGPSYLSSLILNSSVTTPAPLWADYYKFYVKETSGEYYNLLMDRVYLPSSSTDYENEEDHVYLAFNSTDINKVQENAYLVLKKTSSPNEKYISDLNRYKVLDVSATAPDAIAYVYLPVGEVSNNDSSTNLANGAAEGSLFQNSEFRIDKQTNVIEIDKSSWFAFGYPVLKGTGTPGASGVDNTEFVDNIYVSWKKVTPGKPITHSKRYKAVAIEIGDNMRLKLEEEISFEDSELAKGTSDALLDADLEFEVFRKERRDGQNFSGKFFVKVISDDILKNNILGQETNISNSRFVTASNDLFWWADGLSADSYDAVGVNGQFFNPYSTNPQNQPTSLATISGSTNTFEEWDALISEPDYFKKMFIDNMYMVSSSLSEDSYAKNTGQGVIGNGITYPKIEWNFENLENWSVDGDSSWSVSDISTEFWTDDIVNGISGVIEVSDDYIEGPGAWKKDIYTNEADTVYGESEGGYFMHVSFFAPGKDLHDGDFGGSNDLSNVDVNGENSIASLLKGIWGGGAFTKEDGSGFGDLNTGLVEFEGNYLGDDALAEAPGPGVGKGYDLEYKEYHDRQWDPTFSTTTRSFGSISESNKDLEDFIKNLTIGNKFKFKDDSDAEVYTIIDVSIKHIYNHTPWRSMYINDAVNGITRGGNSVEEAAVLWATAKQNGTDQDSSPETNNVTPAQNLVDKINQFGQASNRRTCYILRLDKNPALATYSPVVGGQTDGVDNVDLNTSTKIQFIDANAQASSDLSKNASAIFETEPKDSLDLNIFYEAGQAIPTFLTLANANDFAPVGTRVEMVALPQALRGQNIVTDNMLVSGWEEEDGKLYFNVINESSLQDYTVTDLITDESGDEINVTRIDFQAYNEDLASGNANRAFNYNNSGSVSINYADARVKFYRPDGSYTSCRLLDNDDALNNSPENHGNRYAFVVDKNVDLSLPVGIDWFNCYSFGNGVESNRIKDDFNMPFISNGARVSTTIEEPYPFEEERKYGLIYSGLYNGTSGLNNLNQFIQAEKITKDLNPTYGSIQKLFTRRSDLIAFCEDRVVKILANKDALFNADGNVNLVATENVLGQASPFVGDFGISQNPESFAKESYRAYFTDRSRGAVLRLSMDGLTPISEAGMHDWFRDNIPLAGTLLGTYDDYKKQYNITLDKARYNNILFNSYITEGELLNMSDATFQLITNSELDSGDNYVDLSNDIDFLYQDQETSPILNETFSATTRIINWPGIPRGQMSDYFDNTITQYASLAYTQVVQNYGTVNYTQQAQHGGGAEDGPTYWYPVDDPAVQGTYPEYQGSTAYICRNESGEIPTDPFGFNGYDQYLANTQYAIFTSTLGFTTPDANVFPPLISDYEQVRWRNTNDGNSSLSNTPDQFTNDKNFIEFWNTSNNNKWRGIVFPYSAKHSNGTFYPGNNWSSNYTEGAWNPHLAPPTSAQLEVHPVGISSSGGAYTRNVYNGETIIVKVQYRLGKRYYTGNYPEWRQDAGDIKIDLLDGLAFLGDNNIVSNVGQVTGGPVTGAAMVQGQGGIWEDTFTSVSGTADQTYGSGYQSTNSNTFYDQLAVGVDGIHANFYGGFMDFSPLNPNNNGTDYYMSLDGSQGNIIGNNDVYKDYLHISNIASDTCSFLINTNPLNLDPKNTHYGNTALTGDSLTYQNYLWQYDETNTETGVYDDSAAHDMRFTRDRVILFEFRIFDKDDPWTPKKIVEHLNVRLISKVNKRDRFYVQGIACWIRNRLSEVGSPYIPYGTTQTDTLFDSSAVYGLISEEQQTITLTDTSATVGDAQTTYGSFANLNVTAGTQDATGALDEVTYTVTTASDPTFTPQEVIGAIEQPNENTVGFDPNYGDNGGIPPWAEVINAPPPYFSSYNNTYGNLKAMQEEIYGPANGGAWSTYTYGQDGAETGYYRTGTNNGVTSYTPNVGEPLTSYGTVSNIENGPQSGAKEQYFDVAQGKIIVDTQGASEDSGFRYTHSEQLFYENQWYLVDLEYEGELATNEAFAAYDQSIPLTQYNGGWVWLIGCLDNAVAANCHGQDQDSNVQDSLYPKGAFGMALTNSSKGTLIPLPVIASEYGTGDRKVLRAIFKAHPNSWLFSDDGGNGKKVDFRCYSINSAIEFKSLTVINISNPNNSGAFSDSNWSTQIPFETEHALEVPYSYYNNSRWNWNVPHNPYTYVDGLVNDQIKYTFNNGQLDNVGGSIYTIQYNIDNVPSVGVKGIYYISLVTPQQSNGLFYRVNVQGNFDTVSTGIHEFSVNFETNQITEIQPNGSTVSLSALDSYDDPIDTQVVMPGEVIIAGISDGNGFAMALEQFAMFTGSSAQSGGSVNGWLFQQAQYFNGLFESPITPITTENFVYFENIENNDSLIVLENAPAGVMIYQTLEDALALGQKFNIRFKWTSTQNKFEVYYFTPDSVNGNAKGFRFKNGMSGIDSLLDTSAPFLINEIVEVIDYSSDVNDGLNIFPAFNSDVDIAGALVIRTIPSQQFYSTDEQFEDELTNATIDNITMTQVASYFGKPITVSYSEDVKGWVSFKTFYNNNFEGPESGVSVSTKYFTFNQGRLFQHYNSNSYNSFYGNLNESKIDVILNDSTGVVKDFKTLNYEGSQARYLNPGSAGDPIATDATEFVQNGNPGWYAQTVHTDLSNGTVREFVKKESKWYNYIKGNDTILESLGNLHVQGLGFAQDAPQLMPDVFNINNIEE